jgi:hypothetical protein
VKLCLSRAEGVRDQDVELYKGTGDMLLNKVVEKVAVVQPFLA